MALVDTSVKHYKCEDNFRLLMADELAAQVNYRELRESIYHKDDLPSDIKSELIRRLDEIIKDEEQHLGSLLFCLNLLNPTAMENVHNGSNGA
jgi:hypothetical protein